MPADTALRYGRPMRAPMPLAPLAPLLLAAPALADQASDAAMADITVLVTALIDVPFFMMALGGAQSPTRDAGHRTFARSAGWTGGLAGLVALGIMLSFERYGFAALAGLQVVLAGISLRAGLRRIDPPPD